LRSSPVPGPGKTTDIKRRVQGLVEGDGVDPWRIFVGTFTRAIARDLQAALRERLRVSTLHSLALRLLRENPAALGARKLRFLLKFEEDAMLYDIGEQMPEAGDQLARRGLLARTQCVSCTGAGVARRIRLAGSDRLVVDVNGHRMTRWRVAPG
jgi:superfamily I DNA/RNA helicase